MAQNLVKALQIQGQSSNAITDPLVGQNAQMKSLLENKQLRMQLKQMEAAEAQEAMQQAMQQAGGGGGAMGGGQPQPQGGEGQPQGEPQAADQPGGGVDPLVAAAAGQ
jgi:hypothetical protein